MGSSWQRPTFGKEEISRFLKAIDAELSQPTRIVIVGGAAALLQHGATRRTVDIDIFSKTPTGFERAIEQARIKTGLDVMVEFPSVAQPPEDYEDRLQCVESLQVKNLSVLVPDRYDLSLMKALRADDRDFEVIAQMHLRAPFDINVLVQRYIDEMATTVADESVRNSKFFALIHRVVGPERVSEVSRWVERAPAERLWQASTVVIGATILKRHGIRDATFRSPAVSNGFREGIGGAVLFPIVTPGSGRLSGVLEVNEQGWKFTGEGGSGFWSSRPVSESKSLIVAKDPIEAMCHFQQQGDYGQSYVTFPTGRMNQPRPELVAAVLAKAPLAAIEIIGLSSAAKGQIQTAALERKITRSAPVAGGTWTEHVQGNQDSWIRKQGLTPMRGERER